MYVNVVELVGVVVIEAVYVVSGGGLGVGPTDKMITIWQWFKGLTQELCIFL